MSRLLVHFMGDLHQPLHTCTLFNTNFTAGDQGGNLFTITGLDAKEVDLHTFWDNMLNLIPSVERPVDKKEIEWVADEIMREFS